MGEADQLTPEVNAKNRVDRDITLVLVEIPKPSLVAGHDLFGLLAPRGVTGAAVGGESSLQSDVIRARTVVANFPFLVTPKGIISPVLGPVKMPLRYSRCVLPSRWTT
jgi:hypothetical protein